MALAWLEKARHHLASAELCQEHGFLETTVGRCCYAAYYAAAAVLVVSELADSARLNLRFEKLFVRTAFRRMLLDAGSSPGVASSLWDLDALRNRADYRVMSSVGPRDAAVAVQRAGAIVDAARVALQAS